METQINNVKQALSELTNSDVGQSLINAVGGKENLTNVAKEKLNEIANNAEEADNEGTVLSVTFGDDVTLFDFTGRSEKALIKVLSDLQLQNSHVVLDTMTTNRAKELNDFMVKNLNNKDLEQWNYLYSEFIKLSNVEGVKIQSETEGATYVSKAIRDAIAMEVSKQLRLLNLDANSNVSEAWSVARKKAENKYKTFLKDGKIFCVTEE